MKKLADDLIMPARSQAPRQCPGGCGQLVLGGFWCEECLAREHAKEIKAQFSAARRSVPEGFTWTTDRDLLQERVSGGKTAITKAFKAVKAGEWLRLVGATKAGKTSLAVACMLGVIAIGEGLKASDRERLRGAGIRFFTAADLVAAEREHGLGRGTAPALEMAYRATTLVLDELGTERDTLVASELIHKRHAERRQTIVTSGLSRAELVARYGEAIVRRLDEGVVIVLGKAGE